MHYPAADFKLAFHKHRLHLCDNRSLDPQMGIAPVVSILNVASLFRCDAHSACACCLAFDDQQFAVCAVV